MLENCDAIAISLIYGQFGAIRKMDSGRTVCKAYIFINSHLLSYEKGGNFTPSLHLQTNLLKANQN